MSPELFKSLLVYCGILDQQPTSSENVYSSVQQKSSALLQLPLAEAIEGVEPSVQQKHPAKPPNSSVNHGRPVLPLDSGDAQHPVLLEHKMEGGSFWKGSPFGTGMCIGLSVPCTREMWNRSHTTGTHLMKMRFRQDGEG